MKANNDTVREYEDSIKRVARSFSRSNQDIDDLVQEGRIALVRACESYDPTRGVSFWGYARTFVALAIFKALKLQGRHGARFTCNGFDTNAVIQSEATAEDAYLAGACVEAVTHALEKLGGRERELLIMLGQGHSERAIAKAMGLTRGETCGLLSVATARLRDLVGRVPS